MIYALIIIAFLAITLVGYLLYALSERLDVLVVRLDSAIRQMNSDMETLHSNQKTLESDLKKVFNEFQSTQKEVIKQRNVNKDH